jgi:hypothetical protein
MEKINFITFRINSMKKSKRIRMLLNKLQLKENSWIVQDYWESDLDAIGIASKEKPDHIVYVNIFGKANGLYYYECEVPKDSNDYEVVDKGDNVSFEQLSEIINKHLEKDFE